MTKTYANSRPSHREAVLYSNHTHGVDKPVIVLSTVFDDEAGGFEIATQIYSTPVTGNDELDLKRKEAVIQLRNSWIQGGSIPHFSSLDEITEDTVDLNGSSLFRNDSPVA